MRWSTILIPVSLLGCGTDMQLCLTNGEEVALTTQDLGAVDGREVGFDSALIPSMVLTADPSSTGEAIEWDHCEGGTFTTLDFEVSAVDAQGGTATGSRRRGVDSNYVILSWSPTPGQKAALVEHFSEALEEDFNQLLSSSIRIDLGVDVAFVGLEFQRAAGGTFETVSGTPGLSDLPVEWSP